MAQSLNKVKRRINTINSTRKITNAMKLVSNVKVRKYGKELSNQSLYVEGIARVFNDCVFYNKLNISKKVDSVFLKENKEATKNLYVLISSNLGLCGGYNNEIFKYFSTLYKKGDEIVLIGDKSLIEYNKKDIVHYDDFIKMGENVTMDLIDRLTRFLVSKFLTGEYKEIKLVYHEYKNSLISIPKNMQLLPLNLVENDEYNYDPEFAPSKEKVVNDVIPLYINTLLYQKFYSSLVSEYSARRNAMDNADKNAKDIVDKLKLEYNKQRQQAITQEITEVVAGSNTGK